MIELILNFTAINELVEKKNVSSHTKLKNKSIDLILKPDNQNKSYQYLVSEKKTGEVVGVGREDRKSTQAITAKLMTDGEITAEEIDNFIEADFID